MAGGFHSTSPLNHRVAFVASVTSKLPSALKKDNMIFQSSPLKLKRIWSAFKHCWNELISHNVHIFQVKKHIWEMIWYNSKYLCCNNVKNVSVIPRKIYPIGKQRGGEQCDIRNWKTCQKVTLFYIGMMANVTLSGSEVSVANGII